jgi:23S rRNA (cytidine1920-2'-O)/16S rRNA (cytidine1409-2'-O)-methyltransferase
VKRRSRLDQALVDSGRFPSRSQAQAAIMAGLVFVDGKPAGKAGELVSEENKSKIEVRGKIHPYVSRGGLKLAKALDEFGLDVTGVTAIDIGASTGGFTDCLLQRGAAKVYAVDVGYGQLDWKIRNDPRVVVIERTNVRNLKVEDLFERKAEAGGQRPEVAVIDVSFISLAKVLPAVYNLLTEKADVVALIKPQFEAGRSQVGKGGIVRDEKVRQEVIEKVKAEAKAIGLRTKGLIRSPIEGADGNNEYLIWLGKG